MEYRSPLFLLLAKSTKLRCTFILSHLFNLLSQRTHCCKDLLRTCSVSFLVVFYIRRDVKLVIIKIVFSEVKTKFWKRRKYSSGMRTVHFCGSGRGIQSQGGMVPGGYGPGRGMVLGVWSQRRVWFQEAIVGGGTLWEGMTIPHPVDRMTDACENITFPQLRLRAVKMHF